MTPPMPRYLGLDLHKEYVHGYEWVPGKDKGRHFRFPNTPQSWERFISQHVDRDCIVAFEVTGNALQVYDWLQPHAGQVLPANPVELKRLGSAPYRPHRRRTTGEDGCPGNRSRCLGTPSACPPDALPGGAPGPTGPATDSLPEPGKGGVAAERIPVEAERGYTGMAQPAGAGALAGR